MLDVITSRPSVGTANLLACSNNFSGSAWELYNGSTASNNGNGTWTLVLPGGGSLVPSAVDQKIAWAPSATYTFSVNVKLGSTGTKFRFLFNPGNSGSSGANQFSSDITLTSTLTRQHFTFTTPATLGSGGNTPNICLVPDAAGDAVTFIASQALLVLGSSVGTYGTDTGCPGISPPAPAASWGMNTLTFAEEFNSTAGIDTGNTGAPGFNFYVNGIFGSPGYTSGADYSVSGGAITMTANCSNNCGLTSTHDATTGFTFSEAGGGAYVEYRVQFDPSGFVSGDPFWPALWSMATQHLYSGQNTNFAEFDHFEAFPNGTAAYIFLMALHDWFNTSPVNESFNTNSDLTGSLPGGFAPTTWHLLGSLYVPKSRNGGTGIVERYLDNTLLSGSTVNFTATGPASPGATGGSPANPNGCFSDMDSSAHPIIMGGSAHVPLTVDYAHCWQVSPG